MKDINYWIYLVYPLLLVILFAGSSVAKQDEWNEDALSLKQMKAWQGFVALLIMFHHVSQKWSASWIDKKYFVPGLEFFVPTGYVFTSFFIFASGYGLYKSVHTKKDYLKNKFILRRIVPLIVTGYVVHILFLLVRIFVLHEDMGGNKLLYYISGAQLANPNGWYVIIMPFLYLFFYLAFRFIKNEKVAFVIVLLCTLAYQIFAASFDHNEFCNLVLHDNLDNNGWVRGEWWYNSVELFPIGILFAMNEEKIVAHLKKHYVFYVSLAVLLIYPIYLISQAKFGHTYYCDANPMWDNGMTRMDRTKERFLSLICESLLPIVAVFGAILGSLKIKIGNRFLEVMGKITLEFYLVHGIFVELFCYKFGGQLEPLKYIRNNVLHCEITFALGLPAALLLHKLLHLKKKNAK
ncbi:MAG: acyltransferase family protein [Lachnospiraceae bacterium]|nr:acyltransferase family protein [Lachnospiraceae bacterium]